jgi:hypothetical protein
MLYGWLPSAEFSFWYDVLRSEKPLTLMEWSALPLR